MPTCSETQRTNAFTHVQTHILAEGAAILKWDPAEHHLRPAVRTLNIRLFIIPWVMYDLLRI